MAQIVGWFLQSCHLLKGRRNQIRMAGLRMPIDYSTYVHATQLTSAIGVAALPGLHARHRAGPGQPASRRGRQARRLSRRSETKSPASGSGGAFLCHKGAFTLCGKPFPEWVTFVTYGPRT